MKLYESKTIKEYSFEIKEGILVCRVKPIHDGNFEMEVNYKPIKNYSMEFFLLGKETNDDSENSVFNFVDEAYKTSIDMILTTIKEIYSGNIELDPSDIDNLAYLIEDYE